MAGTVWGPQGVAVHPSLAEGMVRGLCRSSVLRVRPGWCDCKDNSGSLCQQSVLWLGLNSAINMNHSVVNPASPTAKLRSA